MAYIFSVWMMKLFVGGFIVALCVMPGFQRILNGSWSWANKNTRSLTQQQSPLIPRTQKAE